MLVIFRQHTTFLCSQMQQNHDYQVCRNPAYFIATNRGYNRAANYCRTSDNVRLNLANVRAKVILIGRWSDHKKNRHTIHFFAMTKSDCKFIQFAFRNKIYEAFYLTLCRNGYTYLSRDLYISCEL